jgi:hypothetical protein
VQKNLTLDARRQAKQIIPRIQEKQVHNIAWGLLNSANNTCIKSLATKCKFFVLIKSDGKLIIKSLNCEKRKTQIANNTWKMIRKVNEKPVKGMIVLTL